MKVATIVAWADALSGPSPSIAQVAGLVGPVVAEDDDREEVELAPPQPTWTEVVAELGGDGEPGWVGLRVGFAPAEEVDLVQMEAAFGPPENIGPIVDAFTPAPPRFRYLTERGGTWVAIMLTPVTRDASIARVDSIIVRRLSPDEAPSDDADEADHG